MGVWPKAWFENLVYHSHYESDDSIGPCARHCLQGEEELGGSPCKGAMQAFKQARDWQVGECKKSKGEQIFCRKLQVNLCPSVQ